MRRLIDPNEWVRGPYPMEDVTEPVPLTDHQRAAVTAEQRRLGIAVDGVLGVQSWFSIAAEDRS